MTDAILDSILSPNLDISITTRFVDARIKCIYEALA